MSNDPKRTSLAVTAELAEEIAELQRGLVAKWASAGSAQPVEDVSDDEHRKPSGGSEDETVEKKKKAFKSKRRQFQSAPALDPVKPRRKSLTTNAPKVEKPKDSTDRDNSEEVTHLKALVKEQQSQIEELRALVQSLQSRLAADRPRSVEGQGKPSPVTSVNIVLKVSDETSGTSV